MDLAAIVEFMGGVLRASLERPYLLLPFFILEEFGVPFPFILSGLFVYAGVRLSQGDLMVLWMVPVNIGGGMIGASVVYWLARRGLLRFLGRFRRLVRLDETSLNRLHPRIRQWGPVAVLVGRFLPMPMPVTSIVSGLLRIPFLAFLLFIGLANLLWNLLYMSGGVLTGHALSYFIQNLTRPAYLIIVPAALALIGLGALAVFLRRRKSGGSGEDGCPGASPESREPTPR
ncbi:MAG: DedA family protein [Chloroflexi bacterium]|nr:DedA family protein [Chloroflexota bacterium]